MSDPRLSRLSRRDLTTLGFGLALLAACKSRGTDLSRTLGDETVDPTLGQGKRVVVLGGGLAGLSATYRLQDYGFDVTVLEKTNRISGRVWTNRGFFCDNQYCEFGATRIPDVHDKTLGYARMLGLEVMDASFGDADERLYCVNGSRFRKRDLGRPGSPASTYLDAEGDYTKELFAAFGETLTEDDLWQRIKQRGMDGKTFAEWLKNDCNYTDEQVRIVMASNGSEVGMFSASMWMAQEYVERKWDATFRIKGGNDQIAHGLSDRLKTPVTLLADVRGVSRSGAGMSVDYVQGGGTKTVTCDYVVCALPLDVLKRITWSPGLAPAKLEASRAVRMQSVTRVNLQFQKRFWESDEGLKGLKVLHSDFATERLWDMTVSADQKQPLIGKPPKRTGDVTPDLESTCAVPSETACASPADVSEKGILTCYVQSDNALALGKLCPADRIAAVMKDLQRAFPKSQVSDLLVKGNSWVWHQQSWVGGGWAAYAPGQLDLYLATRTPEADGHLIFAGDHTVIEAGWIQGALQSGERAAGEVVAAVRDVTALAG